MNTAGQPLFNREVNMTNILAFDVYGTLIDTAGVTAALEKYIGERAAQFSDGWRVKQLEYSFRRALMQNYCKFSVCTREAFEYTCQSMGVEMKAEEKDLLMQEYRKLPAFSDALETLPKLQSQGFRLYAFSNGPAEDVVALLENAGIAGYFGGVVSTDEIKSFKPNPAVYAHFLRRSNAGGNGAWLISGNPFDVIGALSAGMRGAWVKRSNSAVFDPWEFEPTVTVKTLMELESALRS
jgi:2-haloacid dehalogenase